MNSGDTAWVLMASALVLLMTIPGLAFFYGGLVRRKNVLSILMQCFIIVCVISLQWMLFGYSLTFGPDFHGIIGKLDWIGLAGVRATPNPDYSKTIPHSVFMIFQAMFAIITPDLIIGAYAERVKFSAFLIFTLLWTLPRTLLQRLPVLPGHLLNGGTMDHRPFWERLQELLAGLVAIPPACGFVNPMNAMFIGMIVAVICYLAVAIIKGKLGYNDSLDAFGVHGVGGAVGTIATGIFAEKVVNAVDTEQSSMA
jgi:ammonia channel protein AmtB